MVTVAQLVESLTVTQVVAGSSPVGHPISRISFLRVRMFLFMSVLSSIVTLLYVQRLLMRLTMPLMFRLQSADTLQVY